MKDSPQPVVAPSPLTDLSLQEVYCFECGRAISSMPAWMSGANVKFQCEKCRQKHPRVPGMAEIDTRRTADDLADVTPVPEIAAEPSEDDEMDDDAGDDVVEDEE